MHTPTPAQLLQAWERGGDASAAARGLLLLGCCCEECSPEALATLPLGRRDTLLLELRERLFGSAIDVVTDCPRCTTRIEARFGCDELRLMESDAAASTLEHVAHGYRVQLRLPDSNDLLALEHCSDAGAARELLLERCVLAARKGDEPCRVASLPRELQAGIARTLARDDPQADLQLALCCPECGHAWQPLFDVARFLWQELHAWALHMLRDVDALARTYHWSEADVLAMSPRRRQAYLELCAT